MHIRPAARDVMRVAAFWFQARKSSDEDQSRSARIKFVTSAGEILKPLDVVLDCRLHEIDMAFFDRVKY